MAERERSPSSGDKRLGNASQGLSSTCLRRAGSSGAIPQPADPSQTAPPYQSGDGADLDRNGRPLFYSGRAGR